MQRFETIFFCGHESLYGQAHLEPLLISKVIDVQEIVLASYERWNQFQSLLSGVRIKHTFFGKRDFLKRMKTVVDRIRRIKHCQIRVIDDANTEKEYSEVKKFDIAISAAYPQIFFSGLIHAPHLCAINFHPSFLPRCRGAHPIYWTIASQEPYGGVSCHIMTEKLDAGDILVQRRIDFNPELITYTDLYALVVKETPKLCEDLENYFIQNRSPVSQKGPATYFKNEKEDDLKIVFMNARVDQISAKIRAGRAFALYQFGRKIFFLPPVGILKFDSQGTNKGFDRLVDGSVVALEKHKITIKIGDRLLECGYILNGSTLKGRFARRLARLIDHVLQSPKLVAGDVLS